MTMVNIEQLATSLNVTRRRINQLAHEGMPKAKRGLYEQTACLEWYVRFLQRAVERRESLTRNTTTDEMRRERTRLLQAQAEKVERENRQASGELVPLAEVRRRMSDLITVTRQRLLQLPGRAAAQLEAEPRAVIKAKLTAEIYGTLSALSKPPEYREPGMCDVCGQSLPKSDIAN